MFKSWRPSIPLLISTHVTVVYEHCSSWRIRLALNLATFEPRVGRGGINSREQESCSQVQSTEITIKYEYFMPLGPRLNSRTFVRVFRLRVECDDEAILLHTITPYLGKQIPCLSSLSKKNLHSFGSSLYTSCSKTPSFFMQIRATLSCHG